MPTQNTPALLMPYLVVIVTIGMAAAFVAADFKGRTSRALGLFLASIGVSVVFGDLATANAWGRAPLWGAGMAVFVGISGVAAAEWILRIRQTLPVGTRNAKLGDLALRCGQAMSLVFAAFGLIWPDEYVSRFFTSGEISGWFLVFNIPLWLSLLLVTIGGVSTSLRQPDGPEVLRLTALGLATPFLASSLVLPAGWGLLSLMAGLMVFLVGGVQYHVLQGQRSQFLRRFLAPQVAHLVREHGLGKALGDQVCDISVVSCDLRGFTAFAEKNGSTTTIKLLREYYDAVGAAAAEVGATIKDYAGDGVLLLIGAPVAVDDHRQAALTLCNELHERVTPLAAPHGLGLGVGAASGPASVGVIGGERLEYVAVGEVVNLASRLCEQAESAQTLLDQTLATTGQQQTEAQELLQLKGIAEPVRVWRQAVG